MSLLLSPSWKSHPGQHIGKISACRFKGSTVRGQTQGEPSICNLQSAIRNLKSRVVPPPGLEPGTPGLGIRSSIRLSYGGMRAALLRRWLENSGNVLHQRQFVCKQFSFHYAHRRALSVMPLSLTAQVLFLTLLRSSLHSGWNIVNREQRLEIL